MRDKEIFMITFTVTEDNPCGGSRTKVHRVKYIDVACAQDIQNAIDAFTDKHGQKSLRTIITHSAPIKLT